MKINDATEAWNHAIERGGQPGDEPAAAAARRRTKAIVRRGTRKGRRSPLFSSRS